MADQGDALVFGRYPSQDFPAPIGAAIIDDDDLELSYQGITDSQQTPERYLDHMALVVHRHDNGQLERPDHPCFLNRHAISNSIDRFIHNRCEKSQYSGGT